MGKQRKKLTSSTRPEPIGDTAAMARSLVDRGLASPIILGLRPRTKPTTSTNTGEKIP